VWAAELRLGEKSGCFANNFVRLFEFSDFSLKLSDTSRLAFSANGHRILLS
jgi:hypothetical protein